MTHTAALSTDRFPVAIAALLAAAAVLLATPAARANPEAGVPVVSAAADYLARAQGWYQGTVPTDVGAKSRIVRNGWEWERGAGTGHTNITGVVASAMLDAYESSGDPSLLDHALLYGMSLLNDFRQFRSLTIPYRADIAFMARLSEFTGDPSYREAASAWFGNVARISPTGADEVERTFALRSGTQRALAGYEVAFGIHAAIGVGDVKYAAELADSIWSRRAEWMASPRVRDTWDITSKAALVTAFRALDADRYGAAIDSLLAQLIARQSKDGSWAGSTQATAYSLSALASGNPTRSTRRAAAWLAKALDGEGAWPENLADSRTNVEAQAEALSAYVAFLRAS